MNDLITIEELSKLLDVKPSWVKSMVFKRQIPFVKIGKHIRFSRQAIQKWILDKMIQEDSCN
jgi:excisionase family DNA binding protein